MDISFVQFSDSLPVSNAEEVPSLEPRSIRIYGVDFNKATEVLINDATSPSFVVLDRRTILAQVPHSERLNTIKDVAIISSDFTATVQSKLEFKFGKDPKKISGIKVLMQTYLKLLFTTPGYDSWAKSIGGGALAAIGGSVDIHSNPSLVAGFAISITRAADQMRAMQARKSSIPDSERLMSAEPSGIRFDPNTTAIVARVELISQSGVRAIANLEL